MRWTSCSASTSCISRQFCCTSRLLNSQADTCLLYACFVRSPGKQGKRFNRGILGVSCRQARGKRQSRRPSWRLLVFVRQRTKSRAHPSFHRQCNFRHSLRQNAGCQHARCSYTPDAHTVHKHVSSPVVSRTGSLPLQLQQRTR